MSEFSAFRFRPRLDGMEARYTPAVVAPLPKPESEIALISLLPSTLNSRVVNYLEARLGQRIGGGEAAHAAAEALRAAGAKFLPTGGADDPVWSNTPITQVIGKNGRAVYSNPAARLRPGDVIQLTGVAFSDGRTAKHHTAVVASVDVNGRVTAVYEQNVGRLGKADAKQLRHLVKQPLDLSKLTSGSVTVYRPEARAKQVGRVEYSLVNNTGGEVTVTLAAGKQGKPMSLTALNTANSYRLGAVTFPDTAKPTLTVGGTTITIRDGAAYEVFTLPGGEIGIRML